MRFTTELIYLPSQGWKPAVVVWGRTTLTAILVGYPIRAVRLQAHEAHAFSKTFRYPVRRAARKMLRIGRRAGITKKARQLLRQAARADGLATQPTG